MMLRSGRGYLAEMALRALAAMAVVLMLGQASAIAQTPLPDRLAAPAHGRGNGLIEGGTTAVQSGRAIKVYLFGDSLARGVWRGLRLAFDRDKAVNLVNKAKVSSGFVRDDYFDWNAELAAILDTDEMDIAIVMIGSNDRQRLRRKDGGHQFGESEFQKIYAARVEQFMQQFRRRGILVYWLGLPNMRGKRYPAAMSELNEVFKIRAQANGVTFIPTWDEFSDAVGAYTPYGEDITGTVRRLRADDGVHFTRRGYRKLASLVESQIRDFLASGPVVKGERVMNPGEQQAGLPGTNGAVAPMSIPGEALPQDIGVGRPSAVRERVKASFQATSPAYKVLTLGEAIDPKPGRGDDFSWNR